FGDEDLNAWPFWTSGEGYFARGRALAATGRGREAESDFTQALKFTSDARVRLDIWLALGGNRETNLKDPAAALEAYQEIASVSSGTGSATYFRGVQGAARIMRGQKKF